MILAAAAGAMLAAAAPQPPDLAGLYLTSQREVAGALELRSDGRFRYQLDYGAVAESAEGDWAFDEGAVELTSNPMPTSPDFTLVSDESAPAGELYVAVAEGGLSWTPLSVQITLEGLDRPMQLDAGEDGRIDIPPNRRATSVSMVLPVYETAGTPVALTADRGHRLLFRLEANDIGKAAFHGEALLLEGESLVLHRYGTSIVFHRAEP